METKTVCIPTTSIGLFLGKRGMEVQALEKKCGVKLTVNKQQLYGDTEVLIQGPKKCVEEANRHILTWKQQYKDKNFNAILSLPTNCIQKFIGPDRGHKRYLEKTFSVYINVSMDSRNGKTDVILIGTKQHVTQAHLAIRAWLRRNDRRTDNSQMMNIGTWEGPEKENADASFSRKFKEYEHRKFKQDNDARLSRQKYYNRSYNNGRHVCQDREKEYNNNDTKKENNNDEPGPSEIKQEQNETCEESYMPTLFDQHVESAIEERKVIRSIKKDETNVENEATENTAKDEEKDKKTWKRKKFIPRKMFTDNQNESNSRKYERKKSILGKGMEGKERGKAGSPSNEDLTNNDKPHLDSESTPNKAQTKKNKRGSWYNAKEVIEQKSKSTLDTLETVDKEETTKTENDCTVETVDNEETTKTEPTFNFVEEPMLYDTRTFVKTPCVANGYSSEQVEESDTVSIPDVFRSKAYTPAQNRFESMREISTEDYSFYEIHEDDGEFVRYVFAAEAEYERQCINRNLKYYNERKANTSAKCANSQGNYSLNANYNRICEEFNQEFTTRYALYHPSIKQFYDVPALQNSLLQQYYPQDNNIVSIEEGCNESTNHVYTEHGNYMCNEVYDKLCDEYNRNICEHYELYCPPIKTYYEFPSPMTPLPSIEEESNAEGDDYTEINDDSIEVTQPEHFTLIYNNAENIYEEVITTQDEDVEVSVIEGENGEEGMLQKEVVKEEYIGIVDISHETLPQVMECSYEIHQASAPPCKLSSILEGTDNQTMIPNVEEAAITSESPTQLTAITPNCIVNQYADIILNLLAARTVKQTIQVLKNAIEKTLVLKRFIKRRSPSDKVVILTNQGSTATFLLNALKSHMVNPTVLLSDFVSNRASTLLTTHASARHLSFKNATHVVNYDFPAQMEDYMNRLVQIGKAVKHGEIISYLTSSNANVADDLIQTLEGASQEVPHLLKQMADNYTKSV